ncbi:MAG: nucleotidyltransferase, partial [Lachnospiraceae bacterium]|nr:nucleotidyltransferase [Lachnospiraceae bacterium]
MINNYIVSENDTVIYVMKIIDQGAQGCAFVCDGKRLLAAVSDGDIRRFILNEGNLMAPIKEIANYSPKYKYATDKIDYNEYMSRKSITALPLVDDDKNIVDIIFFNDKALAKKEELNLPVVMMAGGKGVRL